MNATNLYAVTNSKNLAPLIFQHLQPRDLVNLSCSTRPLRRSVNLFLDIPHCKLLKHRFVTSQKSGINLFDLSSLAIDQLISLQDRPEVAVIHPLIKAYLQYVDNPTTEKIPEFETDNHSSNLFNSNVLIAFDCTEQTSQFRFLMRALMSCMHAYQVDLPLSPNEKSTRLTLLNKLLCFHVDSFMPCFFSSDHDKARLRLRLLIINAVHMFTQDPQLRKDVLRHIFFHNLSSSSKTIDQLRKLVGQFCLQFPELSENVHKLFVPVASLSFIGILQSIYTICFKKYNYTVSNSSEALTQITILILILIPTAFYLYLIPKMFSSNFKRSQ